METMTSFVKQRLPVYDIKIHSTDQKFTLDLKVSRLDRPVITVLANPGIRELKKTYPHLSGLKFDNEDDKRDHPIHLILGVGDIAKIKSTGFIAGQHGQPIAENTSFGWTLMGEGKKQSDLNFFVNTVHDDYRQLYSLDVLGIQDSVDGDQQNVYQEFKEQLRRIDDGSYSTRMPWIVHHPDLLDNSSGAKARVHALIRKLKKSPEILEEYHSIMQQQLAEGILEIAPDVATGERTYYMPHRAVIKESAETTKVRIVYDASAKQSNGLVSLNDCLHIGPPIQPHIQNILIRNRMKPVALLGDIKQAFLQIGVEECDRDVLRLYWVKDLASLDEIITLRFTRVPFGCTSSPFILGGTLHEHLDESKAMHSEELDVIDELQKDLIVDDLVTGGITEDEVQHLKDTAILVFKEGKFELHKWHSNIPSLEDEKLESKNEAKILGVFWNKKNDVLGINFRPCKKVQEMTKRGILKSMASVYDPLGVTSPLLLVAKQMYREICDLKLAWDALLQQFDVRWKRWLRSLPDVVMIPRSIPKMNLKITGVELHGFGDASKMGCCSAIYVVVHQGETMSKGLLTANSRIAKRDLSIPRLELIAGHMVANSLCNVRESLASYPIIAIYGWLDSTVALYWIRSSGKEWKQFVSNRVAKIKKKGDIEWRHCPTVDNPADVGSRGSIRLPEVWFDGPKWLGHPDSWPDNIIDHDVPKKTDVERRMTREKVLLVTDGDVNPLNKMLEKFSSLTKLLRVTAWIRRFVNNSRSRKKERGDLSAEEILNASNLWIKQVQRDVRDRDDFQKIARRLDIVPNKDEILVCRGRISGEFPIFLPSNHQFTQLVIKDAHWKTAHGLVGLMMAEVRKNYWIERLRSRVKRIIRECPLYSKYHGKCYSNPPVTTLPDSRTEATRAFETVGVDFAGPLEYKDVDNSSGKSYIALYTCATSRAVYLDLLQDMTIDQFRRCLKEFIARRGNPSMIISDNAKTFQNTAKWLKKALRDPEVVSLLVDAKVTWKFNLSRSPWWGGFFERMVGLTKSVLYKALGRARLSFTALKEVLLDVEVIMNNRPLGYIEEDIQLPVLTPNMLIHGTNVTLPEDPMDDDPDVNEPEPTKLAKHLKKCKDALWCRWKDEYLRAL